jgi:orotate phosphoribosyltransferase
MFDQKQKKTRRLNQVDFAKRTKCVVVEDLISTGNSSLLAVEALRAAGANIKGWPPSLPMDLM